MNAMKFQGTQAATLERNFAEIFGKPKCKITVCYESGLVTESVFNKGDYHGMDTRLDAGSDRFVRIRSEVVR